MFDWIMQPMPWYIGGPLIGLMVPILLLSGNKSFGISSTMRQMCSIALPTKAEFFRNYDLKGSRWNLVFALGVIIGGFIATQFMGAADQVAISDETVADLSALGITDFSGLVPKEIFSWANLLTTRGLIFMVLGGFMVGFGARYAGGCTSGHAIMGLSYLQVASLVAVIGFFAGGLLLTWFGLPYLIAL